MADVRDCCAIVLGSMDGSYVLSNPCTACLCLTGTPLMLMASLLASQVMATSALLGSSALLLHSMPRK